MRFKRHASAAFLLLIAVVLLAPKPFEVSASPFEFATRYYEFDRKRLRWLWWPAILYLFWGMAHVCDIYFVSSIEVFSKKFKIPDDVAGATLMALGCNGPELSLNTIAIFQPSNIGVGAVIGGEVFNVLVIIGTAKEYMPLRVGQYSFWRDVIFYAISVLSKDTESGVYSMTSECSDSPVGAGGTVYYRMSPMLNPRTNQPDPQKVLYWNQASQSADPFSGSVLQIRTEMRNRLMDRAARSDWRYVVLLESALVVSTLIDPRRPVETQ
eukprot:g28566.t1